MYLVSTILAICLGSISIAGPLSSATDATGARQVLILHSYYIHDVFAELTQGGMDETFARSGLQVEVFVEQMDTNRLQPGPLYAAKLAELLKSKYAQTRFDVIIACDNDALDFLRMYRDELFPGVPIVFEGISDFHAGMLDNRADITGIAENRDTAAALSVIRQVRPRVAHIVAITDNTATGQAERAAMTSTVPRMPEGMSLSFLSLGDLTLEELGDRLAVLDQDNAVLLLHASVDHEGRAYSAKETTPYLSRRATVPVFVVSDARVGLGALGGLVTSAYAAGTTSAEMALSIMRGTDIRTIPVLLKAPTRTIFDFVVMKRFGISERNIPADSSIINRPLSILDLYRHQVIAAGVAFLIVTSFVIALALEVLRRRRVEASLRKSQNTIAGILDSVPQGVFWKNREGVYLGCNEVFAKAVGLGHSSALVGRTDFDLSWSREEAEAYRADDAEVVNGNKPKRHIIEPLRQADGNLRLIDTTKVPLLDECRQISGVLGVYEDITDRKKAEEEHVKLLEQLQQSAKMEAVGRLAGGVAHDFNNLLTAIGGNVELAKEDLRSPENLSHYLDEVKKAADSAASLTKQLLAFSRKQIIEPKVIDLNELIGHLQKMLERLIGEDISLQTILAEDLGSVRVDPGQFEQVLVNLAVNARDAMPDGGTLVIESTNVSLDEHYCATHTQVAPGPFVRVAVTDTGLGMTADVKNRLFEPFFTTKTKGRGTGLGLATTFGSITQMGGSIEVYSEVGLGTTFKIYIPRVETPSTPLMPAKPHTGIKGGRESVLLVEDDASVRGLTVTMLQRLGYAVRSAANGAEALKQAGENNEPVDLLITDVVMPGMNGRELSERLLTIYPKLKVLFASGYTENIIVHRGLVDENLNFIAKPYSMQALASKLRQVLE